MYKVLAYSPETGSAFYEHDQVTYYTGYPYSEDSAAAVKNLDLAMYGAMDFVEKYAQFDSYNDLVKFLRAEFMRFGDRAGESREKVIADIDALRMEVAKFENKVNPEPIVRALDSQSFVAINLQDSDLEVDAINVAKSLTLTIRNNFNDLSEEDKNRLMETLVEFLSKTKPGDHSVISLQHHSHQEG